MPSPPRVDKTIVFSAPQASFLGVGPAPNPSPRRQAGLEIACAEARTPGPYPKKKYVVFVSELRNKSKKVEHSVSLFRCINRHLIYHAKYPHPI